MNASCTHYFYIPCSQFNIALQYCNQNCKNTIINIIRVIKIKQTMKHIKLKNLNITQNVEEIKLRGGIFIGSIYFTNIVWFNSAKGLCISDRKITRLQQ